MNALYYRVTVFLNSIVWTPMARVTSL